MHRKECIQDVCGKLQIKSIIFRTLLVQQVLVWRSSSANLFLHTPAVSGPTVRWRMLHASTWIARSMVTTRYSYFLNLGKLQKQDECLCLDWQRCRSCRRRNVRSQRLLKNQNESSLPISWQQQILCMEEWSVYHLCARNGRDTLKWLW
jgi:hypothetical protein